MKKSLHFDSPNTASPFIARNTNSISDECMFVYSAFLVDDALSLTTTQDLMVLDVFSDVIVHV